MPRLTVAPTLVTERLRLRAHRRPDADAVARLWGDPVTTRFVGGAPASPEENWGRLLRYAGHWMLNGYGFWAIEERETGHYVGDAGLFEGRRGLGEDFDEVPEGGWALSPDHHGKGYAQEAVAAALRWGELRFGWRRSVCMIDGANLPSLKTATALGYQQYEERPYKGSPVRLLERVAPAESTQERL